MVLKSLASILLSAALGGLVGSIVASLPLEIYQGGGTSFIASPRFDIVIVFIKGFFSAIYGFVTAVITLVLVNRSIFPQLKVRQVIILTGAFGLIHCLVFAALQYYTSIEGTPSFALDDFARKLLLETAIIEFVTGCLIGLASVIVVKFFNQPAE